MARRAVLRAAAVAAVAALAVACTSSPEVPESVADSSADSGFGLGGNLPPGDPETQSSLALALAAVPPSVLYASFTDLAALKERLGFQGTDSSSPAARRFAFWEAARSDGAMLTGDRLYDDTSLMTDEYGWTADDIAWEIDFSGNETGCTEDMICDPSGGSVLALRRGIDTRTLIGSLVRNGFVLDDAGETWTTDRPGEPFNRAVYLPELNALALGNAIGLIRILEVAGGAPSLADQLPALAGQLGAPEAAYIDTTGCVSLGEALGPDASDDELADYFKANDPSRLAPADAWAATIDSGTSARTYVLLSTEDATVSAADETARRTAIIERWRSAQTGVRFEDVATADVSVDGALERTAYDVDSMPAFAAMVLTHDAPWALCPSAAPA